MGPRVTDSRTRTSMTLLSSYSYCTVVITLLVCGVSCPRLVQSFIASFLSSLLCSFAFLCSRNILSASVLCQPDARHHYHHPDYDSEGGGGGDRDPVFTQYLSSVVGRRSQQGCMYVWSFGR